MPNYRVVELDLSVARTSEAVNLGGVYRRMLVLALPNDAAVSFDAGATTIPLVQVGQTVEIPCDDEPPDDLYVTNEATSGTLRLLVGDLCVDLVGSGGGTLEGLFESTPSAVADGQNKELLIDENGRLIVRLGDALSESEDTVGVASAAPGTHGNAWDAAATGAAGDSAEIDVTGGGVVSVFGNVDGATDLTLWYSQDGTNFYESGNVISLAGAGDFGEDFRVGAAFVRIRSSNNVTATATVANKP